MVLVISRPITIRMVAANSIWASTTNYIGHSKCARQVEQQQGGHCGASATLFRYKAGVFCCCRARFFLTFLVRLSSSNVPRGTKTNAFGNAEDKRSRTTVCSDPKARLCGSVSTPVLGGTPRRGGRQRCWPGSRLLLPTHHPEYTWACLWCRPHNAQGRPPPESPCPSV
jgi:hypothetical protein